MTINVFNYTDPRSYLQDIIKAKQNKNARFSLRAFAQKLGLKNHGHLSMILNEKRPINLVLAQKIKKDLQLETHEAYYFDLLVLLKNSETEEEKILYSSLLAKIVPNSSYNEFSVDSFRVISEWHHLAILELVYLKDFKFDYAWIQSRLIKYVPQEKIREGIDRLISLRYLTYTEDKGLKRSDQYLKTTNNVPCEAIRFFHKQSLSNAIELLEKTPIHLREYTGYTMCIDKSKLPQAKIMIKEFQRQLAKFMETNSGEEVYQFQVQLFPLTRSEEC